MKFEELMNAFGAGIGIPDLMPDASGVCRVDVQGMDISLIDVSEMESVGILAEIGEPPPKGAEMLYRSMMEAMGTGQNGSEATLSIDESSGKLFLHRMLSIRGIALEPFAAELERFVDVLDGWRRKLAEFCPTAPQEEHAGAEVGFMRI